MIGEKNNMENLNIENIIFSAKLADNFNIEKLSTQIDESNYDPDEFSGLIIDFFEPRCAVFIFSNGNLFCTGLNEFEDIDIVINRLSDKLEKYESSILEYINFKIINITASSIFKHNINIENIKSQLNYDIIKNDDIRIPGSIYKIDKSDKNIILLNSGKIIFNGFDDLDEIKSIFKIIKII
jgi:transcription initiation factor TFIID TATA-box-binding protein